MNYTENYQLPQWEETDRVLMEDFNAAMSKVDQGMEGIPRMASGSYVGTGTYGSENPNHLDFGFSAKLVALTGNASNLLKIGTLFIGGQSTSHGIGVTSNSSSGLSMSVTWTDQGVSWYSGDEERQLNKSGVRYFYFALG